MDNEEYFYNTAVNEILFRLGITKPAEYQKKIIKNLLFNNWLKRSVIFDNRLSNRLKICLLFASQGLLADEIAKILNISVGTARNYEKEIIRRLDAKNMKHAIALGIKYGHIPEC